MSLSARNAGYRAPEVDHMPAGEQAVCRTVAGAPPRTLVDVLKDSVSAWPEAAAIDDGTIVWTYSRLDREVVRLAGRLRAQGVGAGDRVGVRLPSGCAPLYLAILAVLAAGAAYVPVDADDPDERAELVWEQAGVCLVLRPRPARGESAEPIEIVPRPQCPPGGRIGRAGLDDDAWIIFTSGSTGTPKGVAITHRSAAAFVDAEARLFLPDAPLGPGDRVLAGLSVAFDASCEEMWLAWRNGACLVPAPRSLVRAGAELGPWLRERVITVVSTVPTLASLWPAGMLDRVRLLILGGEACPPEVVRRFARDGREVWNTYGPTETTVVACAARLYDGEPVRIGLPLEGWSLAVVAPSGQPVRWGEVGELLIGGVGLGRYLDPEREAEKFVSLPALGWGRAYRSGDLVRANPEGLEFVGRADNQVKIGGRRIELGEIDAALLALPSVAAATTVLRRTTGGLDVLVAYLVSNCGDPAQFDHAAATGRLREHLPSALVPRLVALPEFPLTRSGKVDRAALPWPPPQQPPGESAARAMTDETTRWLCDRWEDLLGVPAAPDDDFFALGGTSVAAARLVSLLRERFPEISVADFYRNPTPAALRAHVTNVPASRRRPDAGTLPAPRAEPSGTVRTPWWTGWVQTAVQLGLLTVPGLRWVLALALAGTVWSLFTDESLLPVLPWWVLIPAGLLLLTTPGRMLITTAGIRILRGRMRPGHYRRGGLTHLRLWAVDRLAVVAGLGSIVGTPLAATYARLIGCRVGKDVELHALPPVTGLAEFGAGCSVEPEADLAGWWLDGGRLHIGKIAVGARARVGSRAVLLPGTRIGADAQVLPGACVGTTVPARACWGGSPAGPVDNPDSFDLPTPAARSGRWRLAYRLGSAINGLLFALSAVPAAVLAFQVLPRDATLRAEWLALAGWMPLLVVLELAGYAMLLAAVVRLAGRTLRPGIHPVHGLTGWSAWLVHRLVDNARRTLFPLYAGLITPVWLRLLGARIGRRSELSTVVSLPALLRVGDGAFLADDVLAAPYELRDGWLRLGVAAVGNRAFVGNSGIVGPGRTVTDGALIGVLSTTPADVPVGSSWLGRPALRLPRVPEGGEAARTFDPPRRLVAMRAAVELTRLAPPLLGGLLVAAVSEAILLLWNVAGPLPATLLAGPVLYLAGWLAAGITTAAKRLLMRRITPAQHPLWSGFVWRNELYATFVGVLAEPWFVPSAIGTPALTRWLRSLGARIGRGTWCETQWLPEPDLVHIGANATVNRGCVLQTHLFHDRVMRLNRVQLDQGATLGPHSITLPASSVGHYASVAAGSLVMAAETVPANTRWRGNPITPDATATP